jgi:hypothetical protein
MNHQLVNEEKEGNVKKVKGRKIYPKIPISLLVLFFIFSSDLLSKGTSSSSPPAHGLQGGNKNEDFVSLCLNYREIKTHKNPYEKETK